MIAITNDGPAQTIAARIPMTAIDLIDKVTARQLASRSDWLRAAVLEKLERDKLIHPMSTGKVAA